MDELELDIDDGIARVWLNRPTRHNALNETLIAALHRLLDALAERDDVRVLVLAGRGPDFCAGADLDWMRRMAATDPGHNRDDAARLAALLQRLAQLPQPVLARIRGAAIGGGLGLAAACDIALASRDAHFALSEVRLGLVPATIAPYVVDAIGARQATRYALSAERIDAETALRIGLVHELAADADELDRRIAALCQALRQGAPGAQARCKALLRQARGRDDERDARLRQDGIELLATIRAGDEAREGIAAFFDKRAPRWSGGAR